MCERERRESLVKENNMEEIDELRAKAIASMSSAANPSPCSLKVQSPETREEGELSGEDLNLRTCSPAPPTSVTLDEPIVVAPRRDNAIQIKKSVNNFPASGSSMANTQLPVSIKKNYSKHLKVKQVPFKSRNNGTLSWHGKGSDDNLVISFSDDDSGSDTEDSKLGKHANGKVNRISKFKMPVAPRTLRRPLTNRTKLIPNKGFASHSTVSSATTVRGASYGHGHIQDDQSLETLRHKIAVRESELKVYGKSMLQSKERIAGSYSDQQESQGMKVDTQAAKRPSPVPDIGSTPNDHPMKRLKLDELSKSKICSDGQLQKPKPSTRLISELHTHIHEMDNREGEEHFNGRTDPKFDRQDHEANRVDGISSYSLLNGINDVESLVLTTSASVRNVEVPPKIDSKFPANTVDPSHVENRTSNLTHFEPNVDAGALCRVGAPIHRNLSSESQRRTNIFRGADFSNLLRNKDTKTGIGVPLEAANNMFPDPLLGNDEVNISGMRSMHLETLMKLEELQDKELEEAQELRLRCELEERIALKAYRKAQRALIDANERCTRLYRKRETFSAELRALTMEAFSLGHHMPAVAGYEYNGQCANGVYQQNSGHESESDQCLEPVDSTSAPTVANDICPTTNNRHMSADEDDANFPFDRKSVESRLVSDINAGNHRGKDEIAQDYERLEASLRSTLVARLGARTSSKTYDARNAECTVNKGAERTVESRKTPTSLEHQLEEGEVILTSDMRGIERSGRSNSQPTSQLAGSVGNSLSFADESVRNIDSGKHGEFSWPSERTFSSLPSPNLHIVSRHAKFILPGSFCGSTVTKEKGYLSRTSAGEVSGVVLDVGDCTKEHSPRSTITGKIDPFRPFCMYELRGKCNNEECPWQHIKNGTNGNVKGHKNHVTSSSDVRVTDSSTFGKSNHHGLCHQNLQVPIYKSDHIDLDLHLPWSVLARSNRLYWQRGFCTSLPIDFSVQRILPSDASLLQSGDGLVADDFSRNDLSLCFRSPDGTVKQFEQGLLDSEQLLEMALDLFAGKVYKSNREKLQALSLLSRALETDHNSVVFWVVYLHVFYWKEKCIGKDDMFVHAVQNNEGSYDLWLMYINSRMHLTDRLNAYDYALTSLCQRKDTSHEDDNYTSASILDIFLQMLDFLCMSGNVDKVASRIYQLLPTSHFENSGDTLLSDIHSRLKLSDKCIFWFCCVYLSVYWNLPEPVVQKFEFEKDLPFGVEWPSVQLPNDTKDRALELMKVAVDSMGLGIDDTGHDQTDLRSLHFLAISHVRCVAALEGLDSSAELLEKYMKSYSTCIELVLVSARLNSSERDDDDVIRGFEVALSNWPKEFPGRQCIWNQYAEFALATRGYDYTEKLMVRWFQGFGEGLGSSSELSSDLQPGGGSRSRTEDETFGFLNLFLKRMLQKNLPEARLALDKALEFASPLDYEHCVREHAAFVLSSESDPQSILTTYLADPRASTSPEPLSRRYYQAIKRPRVRELIDRILGSVSRNFSFLNSVLEVCYGPSLVREKFDDLEDLANMVEPVMDITPANYELALSVYRSACKNSSEISIQFWASSILMNSIMTAIPVAPERIWIEAANALRRSESVGIAMRFHQQALSIYPFSIKLWCSYLDLSRANGDANVVVEAARERGVELTL